MKKQGKLFILSAPSGTGKTTVVNAVLGSMIFEYPLKRVITYTSRRPRQGEIDGVDYCFIAQHEFESKIQEGFFIEYSQVYDAYYGSPSSIKEGLSQGDSYILVIDRVGAQLVIPQMECITIWMEPPSLQALRQRLERRAKDEPGVIERRLEIAAQEMAQERQSPCYQHCIINDDFERTVYALRLLILSLVM
ncbi:MAG: guanylate kinase [Candidatus Babeliales bacterium]